MDLYCKKILIQPRSKGLFPEWCRFLRGVVGFMLSGYSSFYSVNDGEAVLFLVVAEVLLSVIALFTARGVFPFWLTAVSTVLASSALVPAMASERARGTRRRTSRNDRRPS